MFGLDLTAGGKMRVVEVHPRSQSELSLLRAAEAATGLPPSLVLHLLAVLLPALPPTEQVSTPLQPLSQIIVHAAEDTEVPALTRPGRRRLSGGPVRPPKAVGRLAYGEALADGKS